MAIPYMGSKSKSCDMIYKLINSKHKQGILVDLFCGGFAVGEIFMKNGWKVIANDRNKYVTALLKEAIIGLDECITSKFITRDEFFKILQNKENYPDWYVGYIMCVWSFGNNQKDYLHGKENEKIKKAIYQLIFENKEIELLNLINIPFEKINKIKNENGWHNKRLALKRICVEMKAGRNFKDMQSLESLERLQRLQIYSKDYKDVKIPAGAIVYCDPPYKDTAKYSEDNFNHDDFWEYCRKLSKTNSVYISEYNAPSDFIPIVSFPRKSTLQGGTQRHNNQPKEKIFIYNFSMENESFGDVCTETASSQ